MDMTAYWFAAPLWDPANYFGAAIDPFVTATGDVIMPVL